MSDEPAGAGGETASGEAESAVEAPGRPTLDEAASTEAAPSPSPYRRSFGDVARTSLSFVWAGSGRIVRLWPGVVVVLVAYIAAAVPLAVTGTGYPQLLGILAAAVFAGAWYGSPMRTWEARRRARKAPAGTM